MKINVMNQVFTMLALCIVTSSVTADSIQELKIKDIESYAKTHSNDKPLIIHLSSAQKIEVVVLALSTILAWTKLQIH